MKIEEMLEKIVLFKGLTSDQISQLIKVARSEEFKAGEIIFKEGEKGDKLYIILSGSVRISKQIPGSGEEALAVLKPGDFFGEMALIDDVERSADAIANEKSSILSIDKNSFESLLFLNKDLAHTILWNFVKTLSRRLRDTNEKLRALLAMKGGF
jgi:CRP/FNR family cyclic AMP-dependent transcriptional regulator